MKRRNDVLELVRAFNEYILTDEFKLEFIMNSELAGDEYDVFGYGVAERKGTGELAIVINLTDGSYHEPTIVQNKIVISGLKNFVYVLDSDDQNPNKFRLEETGSEILDGTSSFKILGNPFIPVYDLNLLHDGDVNIEWKKYNDTYEISNTGALRNTSTKKLVLPCITKTGTRVYNIKGKVTTAARMVAEAFIGPAPSEDMVVIHINGKNYDDRVCNLNWGTVSNRCSDITRTRMSVTRKFLYNVGPDAKANREKLSAAAKAKHASGNDKNNCAKWRKYHVEIVNDDGTSKTYSTAKEYAKTNGFNPSRVYPYVKTGRHFDAGKCYIRRVENILKKGSELQNNTLEGE